MKICTVMLLTGVRTEVHERFMKSLQAREVPRVLFSNTNFISFIYTLISFLSEYLSRFVCTLMRSRLRHIQKDINGYIINICKVIKGI